MQIKPFIFGLTGLLLGISLSLSLSACQTFPPSVYKLDLKQGIKYSKKTIQKIKPGMARAVVEDILGPPSISPISDNQKWYYIYSETQNNQRTHIVKKLTIIFKNNLVTRVISCHA
jgi:outer membrane protein assembly factor BamE (lipoprotein component of BamABCDE complex)